MSNSVLAVSAGGIENPLRASRSLRSGDRRVDREHERAETGGPGALDEGQARVAIAPEVELEPVLAVRGGRRDVLGRGRAHRREHVRDAHPLGDPGDRRLSLVVHQPGEPGRGEDQRQCRAATEQRRGRIGLGDVMEDSRDELDPSERLA